MIKLFVIFLGVFVLLLVGVLLAPIQSGVPFSEIFVVNNLISTEKNIDTKKIKSPFIIAKSKSNINYIALQESIKNTILHTLKNNEGLYFKNILNTEKRMSMKSPLTEKTRITLSYIPKARALTASIAPTSVAINGRKFNTQIFTIGQLADIGNDALIKWGETMLSVKDITEGVDMSLGDILGKDIEVLSLMKKDILIGNPPFHAELWKEKVSDCSNTREGKADIKMQLYYDNASVLMLSSNNHYACTNKSFKIKVSADKLYKISIDYKNIIGKKVQIYYNIRSSYDKSIKHTHTESINLDDNEWHTFSQILDLGKIFGDNVDKVNSIDVYVYSPSNGEKIINLYNNLKISEYTTTSKKSIRINTKSDLILLEDISLKEGENNLTYLNDTTNLLGADSSFEGTLWKENVADCSNTKPGKANIRMSLSNIASDGFYSLKLASGNHSACTSKNFPLKLSNSKRYKFYFDYKNIIGGKVQYYLRLNGVSGEVQIKSETLTETSRNWQTHESIIESKIGNIKSVDVFFYSPSGGEKVINLYDNVRLVEWIPKDIDSYYLYSEQEAYKTPSLNSVEYKNINFWKNKVILHGVKKSLLLSFPEQYSKQWKVYLIRENNNNKLNISKNYFVPIVESNRQATKKELKKFIKNGLISIVGNKFISKFFDTSIRNDNLSNGSFFDTLFKQHIDESMHYKINNYGNAWWVDIEALCKDKNNNLCRINTDNTYDITLIVEHRFNKYLNVLLLASSTVFIIILVYLMISYYHIKKQKK